MCGLKARAGVLKEPLADSAENKSVFGVQISIIIMNQTSICPYFRFQCPRLVQATCFLRSLGLVQCKPLGSLCQGASLSISDLQMRTGWYYSQLSNMLFWLALEGYPRVESGHAMLKPPQPSMTKSGLEADTFKKRRRSRQVAVLCIALCRNFARSLFLRLRPSCRP